MSEIKPFESQEDKDVVWRAILALFQSDKEGDRKIATDLSRIMAREVSWKFPSDAEMAVIAWKAKLLGITL